jgi:hypothetical protein
MPDEATIRKLDTILEDMQSLSNDDPERDHLWADELLKDTILSLETKGTKYLIAQILEAYESVEKWYA